MCGLSEAYASGLKSLVDYQQSVNYCHQFLSQDFVANMHCNFFKGQTVNWPIYYPNHTGKTRLAKEEEEEVEILLFYSCI